MDNNCDEDAILVKSLKFSMKYVSALPPLKGMPSGEQAGQRLCRFNLDGFISSLLQYYFSTMLQTLAWHS